MFLSSILLSFLAYSSPTVQAKSADQTLSQDTIRRQHIEDIFRRTWDGYRTYAANHDSLKPVTNSWVDDRNGWLASAVDALSTAIIMEQEDIVADIIVAIDGIDYSTSRGGEVSVFETTIRYLGGLVSAYDLLTGPYQHIAPEGNGVERIGEQAQALASYLKGAFDTESGVPDNMCTLENGVLTRGGNEENSMASSGTLILEWTRVSDIWGDETYYHLTDRVMQYWLNPTPKDNEPFPGLIGRTISIQNGTITSNSGGWGGGTDSFYEYLLKAYIYDPVRFETYKDRWLLAADSTIQFLATHPTTRSDLTFVAAFEGTETRPEAGHLDCYIGGNFILGGLVLKNKTLVDFGLELTKSGHALYTSTTTGIGPESFGWMMEGQPMEKQKVLSEQDQAFYDNNGFYILNPGYNLRPEVIESFYHAFRATGDAQYQEWVWDAIVAINKTCSVGSGVSSIRNVNPSSGDSVEYGDFQESFWFAEVLKYAYLTFLEDDAPVHVKKDGQNQFVFNTEAHPLRVAANI